MGNKYLSFWQWFLTHKDLIAGFDGKDPFLKELETQISNLGNFVWEIGPGVKKQFSFTISPGGDSKLLELSKKVISFAPILADWEFYYAKQVKEWSYYFETIVEEKKYRLDVSKWEYVLLKYEDLTFDIIIKPVPYPYDLEQEIYGIAEMILDSIIGEERRIEKIKYIEITKEFNSDIINKRTPLINLEKHLNQLS